MRSYTVNIKKINARSSRLGLCPRAGVVAEKMFDYHGKGNKRNTILLTVANIKALLRMEDDGIRLCEIMCGMAGDNKIWDALDKIEEDIQYDKDSKAYELMGHVSVHGAIRNNFRIRNKVARIMHKIIHSTPILKSVL